MKTAEAVRVSEIAPSAAWAVFPIGFATALSLMGDATMYAVLPKHWADAGIALAEVGIILSVNRFIRLLTNGPAGWLLDRLPDRRMVFLGALGLGILSTMLYASTFGMPILFLARLLWGLAWSGIWIGGTAIILQMAPEAQRGQWVGIYQMWFFFGSALGSLLSGVMTDTLGYRPGLWIGAGISALGAIIAFVILYARKIELHQVNVVSSRMDAAMFLPDLRALSQTMWAVIVAQAINRFAFAGILSATMGLVVQASVSGGLNLGPWQIGVASVTGTLLAARLFIGLIGSPIAGTLSDRFGNRWGLLAVSFAMGAIGVILIQLPNSIAMILGTIICAISAGSVQSLTTALVGDLSHRHEHGKSLSLFNNAGDLGSALGPLIAYALIPITGLTTMYLGCALLMVGVVMWSMRFWQNRA